MPRAIQHKSIRWYAEERDGMLLVLRAAKAAVECGEASDVQAWMKRQLLAAAKHELNLKTKA